MSEPINAVDGAENVVRHTEESVDISSDDQFQSPNATKTEDDVVGASDAVSIGSREHLDTAGSDEAAADPSESHGGKNTVSEVIDLSNISSQTETQDDTGSVIETSPTKGLKADDSVGDLTASDAHVDGSLSPKASSPAVADAPPPPLPERAGPPLPPRRRAPFFWLKGKENSITSIASMTSDEGIGGGSRSSGSHSRSRSLASPDYDLILQRIDANNEGLESQDLVQRNASLSGIKQLQQSFLQFREGFSKDNIGRHDSTSSEDDQALTQSSQGEEINWEFWSLVVGDYAQVARTRPAELSAAIATGFPSELRGLIWQLITSSKSASLEEIFFSIQSESSPHEKAIKRDLSRTSFIRNSNVDSLFRIIKGYSLFDPEVGYTQGMAFIAVPLLINMSEPEAFCLLVHIMKDYGFRDMFLPEMPGLHLRLYQYDRLLEDLLPSVHVHLSRQGVRSSMYASQWFLTLFAYKFPLTIVMRIFDIVIAEGLETILKFGVALMMRNQQKILSLDFDSLLSFLKDHLFDYYVDASVGGSSDEPQYRVNELVQDAYRVKLLPITLKKYQNEYNEIHRLEQDRVQEVESLRSQNGQLILRLRRAEEELTAINREHIEVTNTLVEYRVENEQLKDDNEQLNAELEALRQEKKEREEAEAAQQQADSDIEIQNRELLETKTRLETQLDNLERELVSTKTDFDSLTDEHNALKDRWSGLVKHIQGEI